MELTFAHYRNRFCMFRTYYALSMGKVKPDGFDMKVIELPDPPSHEQEEALIRATFRWRIFTCQIFSGENFKGRRSPVFRRNGNRP